MIRSTSEAICETVGSMMAQHGAKNHSLQPKNFNIEMYLRFNLPTLHHSGGLVNDKPGSKQPLKIPLRSSSPI